MGQMHYVAVSSLFYQSHLVVTLCALSYFYMIRMTLESISDDIPQLLQSLNDPVETRKLENLFLRKEMTCNYESRRMISHTNLAYFM
jgi:hypothetical protein